MRALARGANGKPGTTRFPNVSLCSSPRSGTPHISWSEVVLRQGSQINLELGGVRHGYWPGLCAPFLSAHLLSVCAGSTRLRWKVSRLLLM
ncbi:hypothetical protein [Bradyrhizobium brasilense]|uniref:hypothetical protein n=1 Tax=Bradyrhizobium brasilense TaxID=1419277 RepID=UPI003221B757